MFFKIIIISLYGPLLLLSINNILPDITYIVDSLSRCKCFVCDSQRKKGKIPKKH